jgi:hypothetical protein
MSRCSFHFRWRYYYRSQGVLGSLPQHPRVIVHRRALEDGATLKHTQILVDARLLGTVHVKAVDHEEGTVRVGLMVAWVFGGA